MTPWIHPSSYVVWIRLTLMIHAMVYFNATYLWIAKRTWKQFFMSPELSQAEMTYVVIGPAFAILVSSLIHLHLKAPIGPYSVVLPVCKACLNDGYDIIVRSARQNANAKQAKMQIKNAR